ncbi:MAG: hypothetical protein K2R98_28560 [Gemmataceae bacterium]|nr:hypothetical protein [Gemmataceae bacterium]
MLLRTIFIVVIGALTAGATIGQVRPERPPQDPVQKSDTNDDPDTKAKPTSWERPSCFRYFVVRAKGARLEDCKFTPGYYDAKSKTIHCWKGILFPPEQSPYLPPYDRMPEIDPKDVKCKVEDYDPVVSYLKLASNKVVPGYYGLGRKDFYRWKGVELERTELPDDDPKQPDRQILDAKTYKGSVIEVEPPKHVVDKPELWKKVKKEKTDPKDKK